MSDVKSDVPFGRLRVSYEHIDESIRRVNDVEVVVDGHVVARLQATRIGQSAGVRDLVTTTVETIDAEHVAWSRKNH